MMTIAQFADRTGLSPSALRFYERKGLLIPAERLPNGYRVYTEDQMQEAQLISTLRQAGVGLADIRQFLRLDRTGRDAMLAAWRREVAQRLLSIQIAGQFLRGLTAGENQIHLLRWDEPRTMLWFTETAPLGPLPFARAVAERIRQLDRLSITVTAGGYVRPLDLVEGRLTGEVGFAVQLKKSQKAPPEARLEMLPPTLFAALECSSKDLHACNRVHAFIQQFGFQPVGLRLERYIADAADRYQLMIAVMQNPA